MKTGHLRALSHSRARSCSLEVLIAHAVAGFELPQPMLDEVAAAADVIAIGTLRALPEGRAIKRGRPGRAVLLYREGETVRAFKAYCTHHGMELMENGIDGCRVTCLQHGWRFELPDGRSAQGERWGLRELAVRIEDGRFEVLWEE